MFLIEIPIGCEGEMNAAQFTKYCAHFSCILQPKKKGHPYWRITTEDCNNFFWLGVNLNFTSPSPLMQTVKDKILTDK